MRDWLLGESIPDVRGRFVKGRFALDIVLTIDMLFTDQLIHDSGLRFFTKLESSLNI